MAICVFYIMEMNQFFNNFNYEISYIFSHFWTKLIWSNPQDWSFVFSIKLALVFKIYVAFSLLSCRNMSAMKFLCY